MFFVYKITNKVNGLIYFGKSSERRNRFQEHKDDAFDPNPKINKKLPKLYNSIRKYGIEHFTFEILEYFYKETDAYTREDEYIVQYDTIKNGLNVARGRYKKKKLKFSKGSPEVNRMIADKKAKYPVKMIEEIKKDLSEQVPFTEILKIYGISRSYLGKIKRGDYFRWLLPELNDKIDVKRVELPPSEEYARAQLKSKNTKITETDIIKIKELILKGNKYAHIAKLYNVSSGTIEDIASGKHWSSIGPTISMPKLTSITEEQAKEIIELWKQAQPITASQFYKQYKHKMPYLRTFQPIRSLLVRNTTFKHLPR